MLAAVYQHGHDELYAPVEQNCVSILAKLRDHSDEDNEATEARAAKRSRPSARRETEMLERVRSPHLWDRAMACRVPIASPGPISVLPHLTFRNFELYPPAPLTPPRRSTNSATATPTRSSSIASPPHCSGRPAGCGGGSLRSASSARHVRRPLCCPPQVAVGVRAVCVYVSLTQFAPPVIATLNFSAETPPPPQRAPDAHALPNWWVDQAARQQQLRTQQATLPQAPPQPQQFQFVEHPAQPHHAPHHASGAPSMPHFAHPFAHGLPQFSAQPYPTTASMV